MCKIIWLLMVLAVCITLDNQCRAQDRLQAEEIQKAKLVRLGLFFYNTAYETPALKLEAPERDVAMLSGIFQRNCLIDPQVNFNLNLDELNAWIEAMHKRIGDVESLFFYYAGHGYQQGGENHLKLIGRNQSISLNALLARLRIFAPKTTVVMLDCCRNSAPLLEEIEGATRGVKGLAPFVDQAKNNVEVDRDHGLIVSYSAAPNEAASDRDADEPEFSPYAVGFKHALQEKDFNLKQVLDKVKEVVRLHTKGQQEPWIYQDAPLDSMMYPLVLRVPFDGSNQEILIQIQNQNAELRRKIELLNRPR